jgi:hypothetical protein
MRLEEYVSTYDPTEQFIVLRDSWKQVEYALNLNFKFSKDGLIQTSLFQVWGGLL